MTLPACIVPGWGTGPYGQSPWGGSLGATPGGPIPAVYPFDIFCVGPCGPMSVFDTYDEIDVFALSGQLSTTYPEEDLRIVSGGSVASSTAKVLVDVAVPNKWTFEFTANFRDLPTDFLNIPLLHSYVGCASSNDYCAGLFFSLVGIGYTGAINHDGFGNVSLTSAFQVIPGSLGIIQEGIYYTIRIVMDGDTQAVFIYVTESSLLPSIGHQLKFIMPAIHADDHSMSPTEGVTLSVKGTASLPTVLDLDSICLGTGLIIPNLPPIAVAGSDQSVRSCTVVLLDGSQSYDPENAPLQYKWRLIDAPDGSNTVFAGEDGLTFTPSPYTNKFHSVALQTFHNTVGISPGDVLSFGGKFYDVQTTGTDGNGFFVQIDSFVLAANQGPLSFKLMLQGSISNATAVKATFYPDVVGIFKFSLVVFDGQLYSDSYNTIVNVVESLIPRGCTPDVSFIWTYLSDFWKLVDGTESFTTFWSALAQITASEMLSIWQHEYSKSIRDIPRAFQRRWLHYDLFIKEMLPDQTKVSATYAGITSVTLTSPITGFGGSTINISSPITGSFQVYLQGVSMTPAQMREYLDTLLKKVNKDFTVHLYQSNTVLTDFKLHVTAPFYFEMQTGSTCSLFSYPQSSSHLSGLYGMSMGNNTYLLDKSLLNTGIAEGDYLIVGDVSYRIARIISSSSDTFNSMRVITYDTLPLVMGNTWKVCKATVSNYINFYDALVSSGDTAFFEVVSKSDDSSILLPCNVLGVSNHLDKGQLLADVTPILPYLSQPDAYYVFLDSVFRRQYLPVDPLIEALPLLQEFIVNKDDSAVLRQNVDFFLETFRGKTCLRFVVGTTETTDVWQLELPPQRMWAETTYINNEQTIEQNFGIPIGLTLDDKNTIGSNADYLSAVRGLWFTHFNGPTLNNLRIGAQILLGLPFAEEPCRIIDIQTNFSPTMGRILTQDDNEQAIVRFYTYPNKLELEINPTTGALYKVGDLVKQFAPLVGGVLVDDYVKNPEWFVGLVQQGIFNEVEKFFKFMVRVDSDAFNLSALLFCKSFILRIKPTYTYPLFIVTKKTKDSTVDVLDTIQYSGTLNLYDGPCYFYKGLGMLFDDPNPGGGWSAQFDSGSPIIASPTYPTPSPAVYWGYDKNYLCPVDLIVGSMCFTLPGPTLPAFDMSYAWDVGLFTDEFFEGGISSQIAYFPNPGVYLGVPLTVGGAYAINALHILINSTLSEPSTRNLRLVLEVNGVDVRNIDFTTTAGLTYNAALPVTPTLNLVGGETFKLRLEAQGASPLPASWAMINVKIGAIYNWQYDVVVPAGTYCAHKLL